MRAALNAFLYRFIFSVKLTTKLISVKRLPEF
jgi:hypothetical protein